MQVVGATQSAAHCAGWIRADIPKGWLAAIKLSVDQAKHADSVPATTAATTASTCKEASGHTQATKQTAPTGKSPTTSHALKPAPASVKDGDKSAVAVLQRLPLDQVAADAAHPAKPTKAGSDAGNGLHVAFLVMECAGECVSDSKEIC